MRSMVLGAAAAVVMAFGGANAATITQKYGFQTANVTGSFTATFDPTSAGQGPLALDAFAISLPDDYTPAFLVAGSGFAVIGNNCASGGCGVGGTDQFSLSFSYNADGSTFGPGVLMYTTRSPGTHTEEALVVSNVPLPASAPLFGAALLGLAALGYRSKCQRARAA